MRTIRTILSLALLAIPSATALVLARLYRACSRREDAALDEVARVQAAALDDREALLVAETELAQVTRLVEVWKQDAALAHDFERAAFVRAEAAEKARDEAVARVAELEAVKAAAVAWAKSANGPAIRGAEASALFDLVRSGAALAEAPVLHLLQNTPVTPVTPCGLDPNDEDDRGFGFTERPSMATGCQTCERAAAIILGTVPTELPKCIMCGDSWTVSIPATVDDGASERIHSCWRCWKDHGSAAIRARHAARTAIVAPVAAVEPALPWDYCPKCKEQVGDDMRTGEWRDGSEGTCDGCDTVYHAVWYGDDFWRLHEYDAPDSDDEEEESDEPDAVPAPTQDDLDDAAVRSLLERGPATWDEMADALPEREGSTNRHRLPRVCGRVGVCGVRNGGVTTHYVLSHAREPAKDPS